MVSSQRPDQYAPTIRQVTVYLTRAITKDSVHRTSCQLSDTFTLVAMLEPHNSSCADPCRHSCIPIEASEHHIRDMGVDSAGRSQEKDIAQEETTKILGGKGLEGRHGVEQMLCMR